MDHNNILAVVLAGGKSQRFGQDKSQVNLKGKVLIDYILSEIIDEFNETLIVANKTIKFILCHSYTSSIFFKHEDREKVQLLKE